MGLSNLIQIPVRDRGEVFAKAALGDTLWIFAQDHAVSCKPCLRSRKNYMGRLVSLF